MGDYKLNPSHHEPYDHQATMRGRKMDAELRDRAKGRGDFLGDDLSDVHTCHAECPCRDAGDQARTVARGGNRVTGKRVTPAPEGENNE